MTAAWAGVALALLLCAGAHAGDDPAEAGKRIYREGLLPTGQPASAVQLSAKQESAQSACASCHRRSALGGSEGGRVVPPLIGGFLYAASGNGGKARPAYTDETLVRAIREGVDPAGRRLDELMPRYALSDADVARVIAYLKSLSLADPPGVTGTTIRFATVVDANVDPAKRKAMLDVLEAYIRANNAETRQQTRRARAELRAGERMYAGYRKWALHVWELTGPRETWRAQLDAHYARQPVFALLSGIGTQGWRPVHDFCEQQEIPCILPNTDLPVVAEGDFYTVYFSQGLTLEAKALAEHLFEQRVDLPSGPIVQVYADDETGTVPAAALRAALQNRGDGGLRDRRLSSGEALTESFWSELLAQHQPSCVVVWLRDLDLSGLDRLAGKTGVPRIYLSSTLAAGAIPQNLRSNVHLAHQFILPDERQRLLFPTKTWLRQQKIAPADERIQANTYFAVTLAGEALAHNDGRFSREYFLERIEHRESVALINAGHPSISLGPNQRYAAKGAQVVKFSGDGDGRLQPVSKWIVP